MASATPARGKPRKPRAPEPPPPLRAAVRTFPQARARATYEALLEAAREVFAEGGFDATQAPDVAARAGVSVGTFYRYFDDKRQVFVEMLRLHLHEALEQVLAKMSPEKLAVASDRRAALDVVLDALFAQVKRRPALHRVCLAMALRDPEVARIKEEFDALGQHAIARVIGDVVPRDVVADPSAAAYVIQHATIEVALAEAGVRGESRRLGERAAKLALRDMIHRYLFPEAAPAEPTGRTTRG